jgi:hypothetical protein
MPLPLPKLDTRTFADLVSEGRSLVPRAAPVWTDHNVSDPGITLLELFAWLTEMNVYRLDRTQEASYRAFLRMVGVELEPPRAAETVLLIGQDESGAPATELDLPSGLQITTAAGDVVFQTMQSLHVSPAQLVSVRGFGPTKPAPGSAIALHFDRPLATTAATISLHLWTGATADDRETRAALIADWQEAAAEATASCPPGIEPDLPAWSQHYGVTTVWEYWAGDVAGWKPLADVVDETRALTLTGPIRFTAPLDHAPLTGSSPPIYPVRCRITAGHYDCWKRFARIGINAVAVRHAADVDEQLLGTSEGAAGEIYTVPTDAVPIVPGSTAVRVIDPDATETIWSEVAAWDEVGPHDRAYLLADVDGTITTGDGRVGWVPAVGAEIWMRWQIGGGDAGNLAAGSLVVPATGAHNDALVPSWSTVAPILRVEQPVGALGGAAAESLAQGQARAIELLVGPARAVTLADFEALALATPGVPVGRVGAVPQFRPGFPGVHAIGSVTVVVIPDCPGPAPMPTEALLRAVERYLGRRRTVATELHVTGPRYTRVSVVARLHLARGADAAASRASAASALATFFNPLTGGPAATGWPAGRPVYRAEVLALLAALPGVMHVDELGLRVEDEAEPRCGNVELCPDGLVASGRHSFSIAPRSSSR